MENEDTVDLYFYPPKIKNTVLVISLLGFTILGVIICIDALKNEEFINSGIGAFTALICALIGGLVMFKGILGSKPYLILTEKELIISALSKNATVIQRVDIMRYDIGSINFSDYVEIILYDEEKYRARMSKMNKRLNKISASFTRDTPFVIYLSQVKSKDRQRLLYVLDRVLCSDSAEHYYPPREQC